MYVSPKIVVQKVWNIIMYKHYCCSCWDSHYINTEPLDCINPLFCEDCTVDFNLVDDSEKVDFPSWYKIIWAENTIAIPNHKARKAIPKKLYDEVVEYFQWICQYCWCDCLDWSHKITLDHILPVSAWWLNSFSNLVVACSRCNCLLADRLFPDYANKYDFMQQTFKKAR